MSLAMLWQEPLSELEQSHDLLPLEERKELLCQVKGAIDKNDQVVEHSRKSQLLTFWEYGKQVYLIRKQRLYELADPPLSEKAFLGEQVKHLTVDRCYRACRVYEGIPLEWVHEAGKRKAIETCVHLTSGQPMMALWVRRLLFGELLAGRSGVEMTELIERTRAYLAEADAEGRGISEAEVASKIEGWSQELGKLAEHRRLYAKVEELGLYLRTLLAQGVDSQEDDEILDVVERELGAEVEAVKEARQLRGRAEPSRIPVRGKERRRRSRGHNPDRPNPPPPPDPDLPPPPPPPDPDLPPPPDPDLPPPPDPDLPPPPDPDPPPPDRPSAPVPKRWAGNQVDIPVAYPDYEPICGPGSNQAPSAFEKALCILAIGCLYLTRYQQHFVQIWDRHRYEIANQLLLKLYEKGGQVFRRLEALLPIVSDIAKESKKTLLRKAKVTEAEDPQDTYDLLVGLLPLSTELDDAEKHPLGWVSFDASDPLEDPNASELEQAAWPILGLLEQLEKQSNKILLMEDPEIEETLGYQLHHLIHEGSLSAMLVQNVTEQQLGPIIEILNSDSYKAACAREEAARERRIVTLGESSRAKQETIIGKTRDGRLVAITQNSPQFFLILGAQGTGKSHLLNLLMIGALLRWAGTGKLISPNRVIRISTDWNQRASSDYLRAGFYLNPYEWDWETLASEFGIHKGANTPLRGGTLRVLKEGLERIRKEYSDLIDRGLDIDMLQFHYEELTQYGYEVLLNSGRETPRNDKPKYRALLETILAHLGSATSPQKLARELQRTKMDRGARDAMLMQLQWIATMATDQDYLVNTLQAEGPNLIHLQSEHLSADQILPLQVVAVDAMSRPMPHGGGDPHRITLRDEHGSGLDNPSVFKQSRRIGGLLRHRPVTDVMAVHATQGVIKAVAPVTTGLVVFRTPSRREVMALRNNYACMHNVTFEQVARLKDGHALVSSVRASDPEFTQGMVEVQIRPCVTWTAGETYGVVTEEDNDTDEN